MTKRIVCLLLAALMAAGLWVPAYGAEDGPEAPAVAQEELPGTIEAEETPAAGPETETPETAEPVDEPDPQDTATEELEPVDDAKPIPEIDPEPTPQPDVNSGTCGTGVHWELDGTTLAITGNGAMTDYAGKGALAPWYGREITRVTIGSGVTSIGNRAFYECADLSSISITDTVTRIGDEAFEGCASLRGLKLPSRLTTIGARAFYQCASIDTLELPDTVTSVRNDVFAYCTGLRSAVLSSGMRVLNLRLFAGCSSLQTVTIPDSVTAINGGVFDGCTALSAVELPSRLTTLGASAFQRCESLKSVTIPATLPLVGDWAFADCVSLAEVIFAGTDTKLGSQSFANTPWARAQGDFLIVGGTLAEYHGAGGRVTIPGSVTTIGAYAFADCTAVTGVTIPDSVTTIGAGAFTNTRLAAVTIPGSVTAVGDQAFSNIPTLRTVRVAGSVRTIGSDAFWYCPSLTDVYLANGVASVGDYAFADCASLAELVLPPSVTSLGLSALPAEGALRRVTVLNRSCVIGDNAPPAGTVICGYTGSTAQTFAERGGYTFEEYSGAAEPVAPAKRNGWVAQDGKWSYYDNDEPLQSMWLMSARGIWYYMDASGYMVTGLNYVPACQGSFSEKTGRYDRNGTWAAGWYYFETEADSDAPGRVRGGWHETQFGSTLTESKHNGRYGMVTYTDAYGEGQPPRAAGTGLLDGWAHEKGSGDWYFYDMGTAVASAWVRSERGIWYYMDENGVMVTGVHYVPASKGNYEENKGFDPTSAWPGGWYYFETEADSDAPGRVRGGEHVTRFGKTMSESRHNGRYGMVTYTEMYGYGQPPKNA